MKKLKFICFITAMLMVVVSCSDKDSDEFKDLNKYVFAEESADKGKTALENSGDQLMTHMNKMQSLPAMEVMDAMMYYMESGTVFDDFELFMEKIDQSVKEINSDQNLPGLKSTIASDNNSFNANKGVYHWNNATYDWDFAGNSNKIELHFPSAIGGQTNDAVATIDLKVKAANNTPGLELTEMVEFTLKLGNQSLILFKTTTSYNNDDMPTKVTTNLTIENYHFAVNWTYSKNDIKVTYSIKEGSNILVELILNTKGNFDPEDMMMLDPEYMDEVEIDEFVNSANVSLQLADVIILGQANVKAIADAENRIYKDENLPGFDWEQAANEFVTVANANAKLIVVYADNNRKFAESEFYVVEDDYWGEYWVALQLIFADESRGDFESYFGSAFEDLINELTAIMEQLGLYDDDDDYGDGF